MLDRLRVRRSAGVPVSLPVHRLIREGDSARDAGAWGKAAERYAQALAIDPGLLHVWIQRGHAHKEQDDLPAAEIAYGRAIALAPDAAEAQLHLGHLRKRQGDLAAAGRCFLAVARAGDSHGADALKELGRLAEGGDRLSSEALVEAVRALTPVEGAAPPPVPAAHRSAPGTPAETGAAIVFDASDLVSYFRNARLPTGIQRVQIELIRRGLEQDPAGGRVCAFAEARDAWIAVPTPLFLRLCALSVAPGGLDAPAWIAAKAELSLLLATGEVLDFPAGATLVNLGTSWWLQNYFLRVREAKQRHGVRYVPFVHDLIPILASEHCTPELTRDFVSWVIGVFAHADGFLVNSQATARDVRTVAERLGCDLRDDRIEVVSLDGDFCEHAAAPASADALDRLGVSGPFVLFVSTVESRKNHVGALDAWLDLLRRHGPRRTPRLVCVGNRGWLNDAVYARLESHAELKRHVSMLSGVSDAELARLYSDCLFTLYPSHYEGWGLPVTESLCHRKAVVLSDASSLPEAAGAFGTYFEAGSRRDLVAALERLLFEPGARADVERRIREGFHPRPWSEVAAQALSAMRRWGGEPARTLGPPRALPGAYYPIARNFETRIWPGMGSGEVFRAGRGWWWPDDWGCWTKASGGDLLIALPDGMAHPRIYAQLHAPPGIETGFRLEAVDSGITIEGRLRPGTFKWITLSLPGGVAPGAGGLRLRLQGDAVQSLGEATGGLDPRAVAVGLTGFYVCDSSDTTSRLAFMEAAAFGNIDDLSAYRERFGDAQRLGY